MARLALPGLGFATLVAASATVVLTGGEEPSAARSATLASAAMPVIERETQAPVTRDDVRPPLDETPEIAVKATKYATATLDLRLAPTKNAKTDGVVKRGAKLELTGRTQAGRSEIVRDEARRWVTTKFLANSKPKKVKPKPEKDAAPATDAPCPTGSAVEAGLMPDTVRVHRAVCALFPAVTRYGGRGGGGEHASGRALDIMISSSLGDDIAAYVQAHAAELGVTQVIWRQRIWTTQRAGDGWRPMSDRGSATANHYDHVHVTTAGSAGTA